MRSLAARLTIGAIALIVLGGTSFFLIQVNQRITGQRAASRAFDETAREVVGALADARVAQQAYLAAGQDVTFWTPRVVTLAAQALGGIDQLRQLSVTARAGAALSEAVAEIKTFDAIDLRAREYLGAGQSVMAGDLVISEGGQASRSAARLVDQARLAEGQEADAIEAEARWQQTVALSAAALVGVLAVVALMFLPATPAPATEASAGPVREAGDSTMILNLAEELPLREERVVVPETPKPVEDLRPVLAAAADICTALGQSDELTELSALLGRSAGLMGASGVIAWIGEPGGDLRPTVAFGYSPQALARMPAIPRAAENAAAAAYRTGTLQVVRARSSTSPGAIVAPLLSSGGCIGALTAEIEAGREVSESVQALATLFAAQLTTLFTSSPAVAEISREHTASA